MMGARHSVSTSSVEVERERTCYCCALETVCVWSSLCFVLSLPEGALLASYAFRSLLSSALFAPRQGPGGEGSCPISWTVLPLPAHVCQTWGSRYMFQVWCLTVWEMYRAYRRSLARVWWYLFTYHCLKDIMFYLFKCGCPHHSFCYHREWRL